MWTWMITAALLLQPANSLTVTGVVVDPEGKPVSDVEIVLPARRLVDGSNPTLAQSTTDDRGAFRFEVARQRLQEIVRPVLWAYRPGHTVAIQEVDVAANGVIPPIRMTLARPLIRTLTIVGPDDRPLAGVRLAPFFFTVGTPDNLLERLTLATGADGVATIPYLSATDDPSTVRVTAPGLVPHNLPLPFRPGIERITLTLGRPARLAGSVSNNSGQPAANVLVEVWVENSIYRPSVPDGNRLVRGSTSLIHFDSGPIQTRADGSFQTPPQLMTGSTYRVVIHTEDGPPVTSDMLPAKTELTNVPPFRLRQVRKLVGRVLDRGGGPVAGARVLLPSRGPTTTTDAQGRFVLEGVLPDRTYLLVQAKGFRFQGWPAIPARQPQERKHTLARTSEPPDRTMTPMPPPISLEESRALARRVLEPYLRAALEKGDINTRFESLRTLSKIDPAEALALFEKHALQMPRLADDLRITVALERLAADPAGAVSIVETIATPGNRGLGFQRLAAALPALERDRKRTLLERATLRAHGAAEGAAGYEFLVYELGQIAESWLNLGEVEKARALILEGIKSLEGVPPAQRRLNRDFLSTAARIELDRVLSLVKDTTYPRFPRAHDSLAAIAASLANDHPAQAERVFQLFDREPLTPTFAYQKARLVLQLSRRMARTDPEWMRRIIDGLNAPGEQACAWALLAVGLADRDKPAAHAALTESIQIIDRFLDIDGAGERSVRDQRTLATLQLPMIATNPAASILPIVEKVAPERVEEVFWRAVALMPKYDPVLLNIASARAAVPAIFLARYDRQAAAALSTQVDQALRSPPRGRPGHFQEFIWAKAAIDPRGAVTLIEALPPGGADQTHPTNRDRIELATRLAESSEAPWKRVWRDFGIDFD